MCDFKIGDEITPIDDDPWLDDIGVTSGPKFGAVCVVSEVLFACGRPWVALREFPGHYFGASAFRKVQRRDLNAWLATENTVEGPVREQVPA